MTDAPNTLPDTDPADQINDQALKAKRKKSLGFVVVILIIAAILFLIWKLFLTIRFQRIMLMWAQKRPRLPLW